MLRCCVVIISLLFFLSACEQSEQSTLSPVKAVKVMVMGEKSSGLKREISGIVKSDLQVEAFMPKTLIHDIAINDEVEITFPTLKDTFVKGKISQIDTDIQSGNAFLIKVAFNKNFADLRTGMTAVLRFEQFKEKQPNFRLPLSAIDFRFTDEKTTHNKAVNIYVFDAVNQVAKRKSIIVGDVVHNEIEVKQGLVLGEEVIVAGVPFIHEGQTVKRWQPSGHALITDGV